ncbi:MAG TPA: N-acetylmuramoyl-L-alanine amidase [Chthoniobacteraceae bacterium]|jgi:N-acetylmuramoyl-L-alanine amidase|nr:N-acetylmuramoyl-L-alanine amidase [Chthoniobacteraceae bacterium]
MNPSWDRSRRRRGSGRAALALWLFLLLLPLGAFAFTTVVIDPGHGGIDRGGIPGQRVAEKTMTLDTAFRLRRLLEAAGFRTVMTRTSDTFVSLPARVAIANAQRNAIFISLHYNAAPREGAEGFGAYYYNRRSARLAMACYSHIIQAWPGTPRGVQIRGFYVIRKTRIPSILVEPGFLTNAREASLISRPEVRQRIAALLAAAIISERRL